MKYVLDVKDMKLTFYTIHRIVEKEKPLHCVDLHFMDADEKTEHILKLNLKGLKALKDVLTKTTTCLRAIEQGKMPKDPWKKLKKIVKVEQEKERYIG